MTDWWVMEQHPPIKGKLDVLGARAKMGTYMTELGVNFHPGRNYWQPVRCPFHDDRHASASLSLGHQRFNCHACGVRGDAIDLVMEDQRITIKEAVAWLLGL
jgi:hypothetical protein